MILLICGGRRFFDYKMLCDAIEALPFSPTLVVEGGATGADSLGKAWAIQNNVHYAEVPALWNSRNKKAGFDRNSAMLLLKPECCLAMPGGNGTADMVRKCREAGVPVWEPYE